MLLWKSLCNWCFCFRWAKLLFIFYYFYCCRREYRTKYLKKCESKQITWVVIQNNCLKTQVKIVQKIFFHYMRRFWRTVFHTSHTAHPITIISDETFFFFVVTNNSQTPNAIDQASNASIPLHGRKKII